MTKNRETPAKPRELASLDYSNFGLIGNGIILDQGIILILASTCKLMPPTILALKGWGEGRVCTNG